MRIGFDLAQTIPPLAGCGWYAHSLFESLTATAPGHEFVAYPSFARWLNEPGRTSALPARPNVRDACAGLSFRQTEALWQSAREHRRAPLQPDIVHSTSFQAPCFEGAKLVVTIYDLSFWATPEFTTDTIRLHCQSDVLDCLEQADGLVFISEHARREFDRFLPRYRRKGRIATTVTPLAGRWPAEHKPGAGDGHFWLSVGSLEPRKNLGGLLDALEEYARQTDRPKPLWIAGGSGWKNEEINARIDMLTGRGLVRRLGYVPDSQLQQLYREAHALVFPSWYEGFGLPVLEAMRQGCPVICSDTSSLPEVGGEAVRYVQPGNPGSIAEAMLQLDRDAVCRSGLIQRGLTQAGRFSWEQTAKQTLAFYDQLLSAE